VRCSSIHRGIKACAGSGRTAAAPKDATTQRSWESPILPARPEAGAVLSERAHQDREIRVISCSSLSRISFSLYHDYTESRTGSQRLRQRRARRGKRRKPPFRQRPGHRRATHSQEMSGAEDARFQDQQRRGGSGRRAASWSSRSRAVQAGQSVRLRIAETLHRRRSGPMPKVRLEMAIEKLIFEFGNHSSFAHSSRTSPQRGPRG